ncbi:MAG: hypothetical protein H7175_19215, partial [Burkholderiales bacterium]|nr:hypothetical protein [Anaerolineae bacterium]
IAGALRMAYELLVARRIQYRFMWLDAPVIFFFVWSLISIFNPDNTLVVGLIGFKSTSLYILLYALLRLSAEPLSAMLGRLYPVIVVGALIGAVYGLIQSQLGFQGFEVRWIFSEETQIAGENGTLGYIIAQEGIIRPFSTFASHEQLAWYLGLVSMFLVPYAQASQSLKSSLLWVVVGMYYVTIVRTLSRSAWVGLGAGAGILFLLGLRYQRRAAFSAVLIVVLFGVSYLLWNVINASPSSLIVRPQTTQAELEAMLSGAATPVPETPIEALTDTEAFSRRASLTGTYEWRIYTFQALLYDPAWHTPFGHGIGSMWYAWRLGVPGAGVAGPMNGIDGPYEMRPGRRVLSHIGLVDIIYELGIFGFGLFVWMLGALVWFGIRHLLRYPQSPYKVWLLVALAAVLGVVFGNSVAATVLIFRPIGAMFWLFVGIIGAAVAIERNGVMALSETEQDASLTVKQIR